MKSIIFKLIILSFVLFAITGCSKGGSDPVQPDTEGESDHPALRMASGRNLIGVWEIHLRSDVSGADVRINRTVQSHVNALTYEDFAVVVDYEKPSGEDINDYNPNFGFRGWAIWRLQINLTNGTDSDLYDVRGIIRVSEDALGLHNADGLTTLWDAEEDLNPFKYYGAILPDANKTMEFQVEFEPPDISESLDCSTCYWPGEFEYTGTGGGKWDPDGAFIQYKEQDVWVNFAVDASTETYCLEPYLLDGASTFSGSLEDPSLTVTINAEVHPQGNNEIESVGIMLLAFEDSTGLPGYENDWNTTWFNMEGGAGTMTFNGIPAQVHEGIYYARIRAISALPTEQEQEPYDNPNTMYKDIRLLVGDFEELIDNMFTVDIEFLTLYEEILYEWEDRAEHIYDPQDDGFEIDIYDDTDPLEHVFLIKYHVWYPLQGEMDEYGILRIPLGVPLYPQKPDDGWPLMVFCHFGRAACYLGCTDGFFTQNQYKYKFAELIPRYRGNALCWDGDEYFSYDNDVNSPADWDVDDVLAFLNVVIEHKADIETEIGYEPEPYTPLLDDSRVGIMGGSRGGSPTYLAKIRDTLFGPGIIDRALITIGSVTNFFIENIAESCEIYFDNDGYVPEDTHHYFLEDYNVFARVLEPYLDGELSWDDARKRLIRSSPYYFAGALGNVQVHHGGRDLLARPAQTQAIKDIFGFVPNVTEILFYPTQPHSIDKYAWSSTPPDSQQYKDWTAHWLNLTGGYPDE